MQGCLVSGPSGSSASDVYQDSRKVSDMAVVLENTAAWQSLAAGGSPQSLQLVQAWRQLAAREWYGGAGCHARLGVVLLLGYTWNQCCGEPACVRHSMLFCHCCRAVCCTWHLGAVHPILQDSLSAGRTLLSAASEIMIRQGCEPRNAVAHPERLMIMSLVAPARHATTASE